MPDARKTTWCVMTPEQLAEIEARANAATPGPWSRTLTPGRDRARAWLLEAFDASDGDGIHGVAIAAPGKPIEEECLSTAITGNGPTSEANAIFIAHARTDIPTLVAAVRERYAEIAKLKIQLTAATTCEACGSDLAAFCDGPCVGEALRGTK